MRATLYALAVYVLLSPVCTRAQTPRWSFSPGQANATVEGNVAYRPGLHGQALVLDGYTTGVTAPAASLTALTAAATKGFTVQAVVALNTYPWNWLPLVDGESRHQAGFALSLDAFGHVSLGASLDGQWRTALSTAVVPLKQWARLTGVYRREGEGGTLEVYLNGKLAAQTAVTGTFSPASIDLLLGRVRTPTLPFPEAEVKPPQPVWYSLDGLLDEATLEAGAKTAEELAAEPPLPPGEVLPWTRMPAGTATPGRFGAFYASLPYEEAWDRLRTRGPDGDVVVRFDDTPSRLVFWQGLNYIPAWVTGDDKWYTDEFLEVWDQGCPDGGDCEPMSDKQGRFSRVEILESNAVRAVVHWRYALVEAVGLKPAWPDPRTGEGDWADEYWTVYPDGVAIRKQVLHSTHPDNVHEWQETIVLHQPGMRPEDDIESTAITLANLQGQTKSYTWAPHVPGTFADPHGPEDTTTPPGANIQRVNLKSRWKPFQIVSPEGVSSDFYNNEKSYFQFECWNHWPVAQILSSDRACVTDDRPSHSSLSHLFSQPYEHTANTATKLLMSGLTERGIADLIPLAKSWLSPPALTMQTPGVHGNYDPAQRAYVLSGGGAELKMRLEASPASPLRHAALLIKHWQGAEPTLRLGGKALPAGDKRVRTALVPRLEGTDLLVWLALEATSPVEIALTR